MENDLERKVLRMYNDSECKITQNAKLKMGQNAKLLKMQNDKECKISQSTKCLRI